MAIRVLLLAVGSYLGGKDHGIGAIVTDAIKTAVQHATDSSKLGRSVSRPSGGGGGRGAAATPLGG